MSKGILIVDFDDTIVNSRKAVSEYYIEKYKHYVGYKEPNWKEIRANGYKDQCPLFKTRMSLLNAFNSDFYFERVELFDGAKEVLKELSEVYTIKICTLGLKENIDKKLKFVDKKLDFIGSKNVRSIEHNGEVVDKSTVDMCGATFIDDKSRNLLSSNADRKICFGIVAEWNEDWQGERVSNWYEILGRLRG